MAHGSGRQQTLSATLDWSYVLLDEHEQAVFDRLAVFVGWFTADDAVAVAGDPRLDQHNVIDALSGLVDKSMCASGLSTTPARYRYLETMRSYGRDHLTPSRDTGGMPRPSRHGTTVEDVLRLAGSVGDASEHPIAAAIAVAASIHDELTPFA